MTKMNLTQMMFILLLMPIHVFGQDAGNEAVIPWTAQEIRLVDEPDEIVATLENGMVAIVKENHTASVAAVRLYVRTGSIYEDDLLGSGVSHLFEHLLAGGTTTTRSEEESRQIIQQTGARYNAFTSKAMTCYYLTVPSQHVGTALNLIADWVTKPAFPDDEFDREWGVVQRELEMGATDPRRQLFKVFDELRYKVHPAKYPIIGHQSIVQQLTRQQILDYYKKKYVPDNMVISIAGDIDAETMFQAIRKEFKGLVRRANPVNVLPEEPDVIAPREMIQVMPSLRGPAQMRFGFPSFELQHPDLYALDTLASILGQGKSSRLYRRLREQDQTVVHVTAWNSTPNWAKGSFAITCYLAPENIEVVKATIREELERLKTEPVSDAELNRAKNRLQFDHIKSHQTAEQIASSMAEDYLATGDPHFSRNYVENMQKVTSQQVLEMANKYFDPQKELAAILVSKPLESSEETTSVEDKQTVVKKVELENGIRILLKQESSVPLVNIQCYVMGGLLDENASINGITNVMTGLSLKGTESYSSLEIVNFFDDVGGTIQARAGNNTFYYQSDVMSKDVDKAFDIFSEVILKPTFLDDELVKVKQESLATIEQINNSWQLNARSHFRQNFFENSPYKFSNYGLKDSVEQLTREDIAKFHKASVVGSRMVIAVFGDIDINTAEAMVREKFSGIPKGSPMVLEDYPQDAIPKTSRKFVEKTEKQGATVYIGYPGMKLSNVQERYAMEVLREIVGSNNGWFHETLRGQQLVYYAWGENFLGLLTGYFGATAQCEAQKVPQVIDLLRSLIKKAASGEITIEELDLAKSNRINAEILNKQTNSDSAMTMALDELYGYGYDWSKNHADRIMAVTLEDVNAIAAKYLTQPETITVITSEPELLEQKTTPAP